MKKKIKVGILGIGRISKKHLSAVKKNNKFFKIIAICDLNNHKLKNNINVKDIIKSMMPGGSVIGCPKIRTIQLLNSQEKEGRNIFTGSFGFIKFNMDMRFNIIIRSILNFKNISEISAASGVVLDSFSKKEFNENYIKAKSLLELFK